ncbi:hypothetical protein SLNHY_0971 [Streptomyces albus]|nr:hypothetical protein SLNHY_0971 [Streptomyces albus]
MGIGVAESPGTTVYARRFSGARPLKGFVRDVAPIARLTSRALLPDNPSVAGDAEWRNPAPNPTCPVAVPVAVPTAPVVAVPVAGRAPAARCEAALAPR